MCDANIILHNCQGLRTISHQKQNGLHVTIALKDLSLVEQVQSVQVHFTVDSRILDRLMLDSENSHKISLTMRKWLLLNEGHILQNTSYHYQGLCCLKYTFCFVRKEHYGQSLLHPSDMAQGPTILLTNLCHFKHVLTLRVWSLCRPRLTL